MLNDYEVCRYMQLENGLHADVYALEIIIPVAFTVKDVYKRQAIIISDIFQFLQKILRSHF